MRITKSEGWNFEVTCIAFHAGSGRILTATRDGYIQGWLFEHGELKALFQTFICGSVAKGIVFTNSPTLDAYAFGIYDGRWYVTNYASMISIMISSSVIF